jgi:eukaryotic-like serine/threonine-protein kinase
MQLTCARCNHVLEYAGERPLFCGFCGQPLPRETAERTAAYTPSTLTPATPPGAGEEMPPTVGGYRLLRELGSGGMGKVYEAEDAASGRRVAVKLIAADFAASQGAVDRFRQEGRLASAIAHPRCVFVLAADEEAGRTSSWS